MKKIIIYLFAPLLIAAGFCLSSCNNPAPTQLVQDNPDNQNQVQYEVISKDPTDAFYSNGFDTTGITSTIPNRVNVINISGTKVTENNTTRNFSFAQAVFYDRSNPVMGPGSRLIGYRTFIPGMLRFNGVTADTTPCKIRFSYNGTVTDSLLGEKYLINNHFNFNYNSLVHVQYYPGHFMHGNPIDFYVPTPKEINGTIKISGYRANRSLSAEVDWNKINPRDSVLLVLGAVSIQGNSFPLYRIRTLDIGKLTIPAKLLNEIPASRFNKLVFTFVRRISISHREGNNELYVLSQSIHSIILNIP